VEVVHRSSIATRGCVSEKGTQWVTQNMHLVVFNHGAKVGSMDCLKSCTPHSLHVYHRLSVHIQDPVKAKVTIKVLSFFGYRDHLPPSVWSQGEQASNYTHSFTLSEASKRWSLSYSIFTRTLHNMCFFMKINITMGVSHTLCGLAICIKISILRQKKKNDGNSNISPCQNMIFKKSSKRNQNRSQYYNFITNLKFQTQAKISYFKNPHIKIYRPIIIIT
jgi:hypothetical protein